MYIIALTDSPVEPWTAGRRRVRSLDLDGIHVLYEQRRAAPDASDETLREQHALVVDAARRASAILPVRFGALMEKRALLESIRVHEDEIRRGLDEVRDRVQMTIRVIGRRPPVSTAPVSSGREYLRRRRQLTAPPLPPSARALLTALAPLVTTERREPAAGRVLATVYHLVRRADVERYKRVVNRLASASAIVTGPWPPFAFTPRIG